MAGTVALSVTGTLVFISIHKLISFVIQQSVEGLLDAASHQIFEIVLY